MSEQSKQVHLFGHAVEKRTKRNVIGDDDSTNIGAATYGYRWDSLVIHASASARSSG